MSRDIPRLENLRSEALNWPSIVIAKVDCVRIAYFIMGVAAAGTTPFRASTRGIAQVPKPGDTVALRDAEGVLIAALDVQRVIEQSEDAVIEGILRPIEAPSFHGFREFRYDPQTVLSELQALGLQRVWGVFPDDPPTEGFLAQLRKRGDQLAEKLLVFSWADPDDPISFVRTKTLRELCRAEGDAWRLIVIPGPIEGIATEKDIGKAFGVTDLLVPSDEPAKPALSATALESAAGGLLPEAVIASWRAASLPLEQQGITLFFTGLSGSGKSTLAQALRVRILEESARRVTLLDGDLVRRHLSSELGFSREHRNINVLRIGFVAGEIARHGGITICAPIAPYAEIRAAVREMTIERGGAFYLIHVATPLEVCEARDRKGLYAKARAGLLREFTGIDDPYEPPIDADITIDTGQIDCNAGVAMIMDRLCKDGYVVPSEAR